MKTILKILGVEKRVSKDGKPYYITIAKLTDQEVYEGYGKDFAVGDKVTAWFDDQWQKAKMQK